MNEKLGRPKALIDMDRRTFIACACTFLGGPLAVEAQLQQARRDWRIGILAPYALDDSWSKELAQALRDAGYVDGHNGRTEWRSAEDQTARLVAAPTRYRPGGTDAITNRSLI
jgi:hypothetical protein